MADEVTNFKECPEGHHFGVVVIPNGLHYNTKGLVLSFAEAVAEKLHAAEKKYGYSNGWKNTDWMNECRKDLLSHLYKGDPLDVAAYAAFLWYHKEPTFIKEDS